MTRTITLQNAREANIFASAVDWVNDSSLSMRAITHQDGTVTLTYKDEDSNDNESEELSIEPFSEFAADVESQLNCQDTSTV